jgi:hypothetical protein
MDGDLLVWKVMSNSNAQRPSEGRELTLAREKKKNWPFGALEGLTGDSVFCERSSHPHTVILKDAALFW